MTEVTLVAAIKRWNERKLAGGVEHSKEAQPEDVARALLSGFDLDYEEVLGLKLKLSAGPSEALVAGVDVVEVFTGQWIDGLMTGLMLAELKENERNG